MQQVGRERSSFDASPGGSHLLCKAEHLSMEKPMCLLGWLHALEHRRTHFNLLNEAKGRFELWLPMLDIILTRKIYASSDL